jgi:hypothetical protein
LGAFGLGMVGNTSEARERLKYVAGRTEPATCYMLNMYLPYFKYRVQAFGDKVWIIDFGPNWQLDLRRSKPQDGPNHVWA